MSVNESVFIEKKLLFLKIINTEMDVWEKSEIVYRDLQKYFWNASSIFFYINT